MNKTVFAVVTALGVGCEKQNQYNSEQEQQAIVEIRYLMLGVIPDQQSTWPPSKEQTALSYLQRDSLPDVCYGAFRGLELRLDEIEHRCYRESTTFYIESTTFPEVESCLRDNTLYSRLLGKQEHIYNLCLYHTEPLDLPEAVL